MPTIERTLKELEHWFSTIQALKAQQRELRPENFIDEEGYDEQKHKLDEDIRSSHRKLNAVLERYEREPQRHYLRHLKELEEFHKEGVYDESVFIMTKYPTKGDPMADKLQTVIDAVIDGIRKRNYKPRICTDAIHHRWLWDNVELYLLGCSRGVAIVEDKYLPELNPNVAMEWGWMAGMDRKVLFLRELGFNHDRADWQGLNDARFDWDDPTPGIEEALDKFLPKRLALP
ncbi:MAG TPA: hypothetical protein VIW80_04285 [Pyrinomonadaceae bacterium]